MSDDLSDLVLDNKKQLKTVENLRKPKGGRPRKKESEKLSKKVTVNFSYDEFDLLSEKAGSIPLAIFIKMALKDKRII